MWSRNRTECTRRFWRDPSVKSAICSFLFIGLYSYLLAAASAANNNVSNQINVNFIVKFLFELSILWISTCILGLIVGVNFINYLHKTQVTDIVFPLKSDEHNFTSEFHYTDKEVHRLLPLNLKLTDKCPISNFDDSTIDMQNMSNEYESDQLHQHEGTHLETNRSTQDTLTLTPVATVYSKVFEEGAYYPLPEPFADVRDQVYQPSTFKTIMFASFEGVGLLASQVCLLEALQSSSTFQWGVIITLAYSDSFLKPLIFYHTKNLYSLTLFGAIMILFMVLVTVQDVADQKLLGMAFLSGLITFSVGLLVYNKTNHLIPRSSSYMVRYVVQGSVGLCLCICLICHSTSREILFNQIYFTSAPKSLAIKSQLAANRLSLLLFVCASISHSCFVWYLNKACAESLTVAERLLTISPLCSVIPVIASWIQFKSFNQLWTLLLMFSWMSVIGISIPSCCMTSFENYNFVTTRPTNSFSHLLPLESSTKMVTSSSYVMVDST